MLYRTQLAVTIGTTSSDTNAVGRDTTIFHYKPRTGCVWQSRPVWVTLPAVASSCATQSRLANGHTPIMANIFVSPVACSHRCVKNEVKTLLIFD